MLLCVGDLIEDVVVWLPGPVALGSDTEVRITRERGGSAANVAAATVRAGGQARFVGQLGDDELAHRLLHGLAVTGVDVVARHGGRTGTIIVLVDDRGEILGAATLAHDVTATREAEERLLAERNLLHAVMNGTTNAHLVYLDRDFNFIHVNYCYAASCGFRPEEMIGKNHFTLYPNQENEAIFRRVRDTGDPFEVMRFTSRTGAFEAFEGLAAAPGIYLKPAVTETSVTLTAVARVTVALAAGWNAVSLPIEPADPAVESGLAATGREEPFQWLLLAALVSDILDGLIARSFGLVSELGARLDSIADALTMGAAAYGVVRLQPEFVHAHGAWMVLVLGLYIPPYLVGWYRQAAALIG